MTVLRRDVLRAGFAATGGLLASAIPFEPAEASPAAFLAEGSRLINAVWRFGKSVLHAGAANLLSDWLRDVWTTPAPAPRTWAQRFDPPVVINVRQNAMFVAPTANPSRKLVVSRKPAVVRKEDAYVQPHHTLNHRELSELSNRNNNLLWDNWSGYRIPIMMSERRPIWYYREQVEFKRLMAQMGEYCAMPDYVRDFCRCDGLRMMGFGYTNDQGPDGETFRIVQPSWV